MSTVNPTSIVAAFISAVWAKGDIVSIPQFVHPEYAADGVDMGVEGVSANVAAFRAAFPDLSIRVLHLSANQDEVASLVEFSGTQTGAWKGFGATGKHAVWPEAGFWTVENDRITSARFVADALGLRIQLGLLPASAWTGATERA